jgi:hypothetical protein
MVKTLGSRAVNKYIYIYINFSCIFFYLQFLVSKTLDPDSDSLEMPDPDPQHWLAEMCSESAFMRNWTQIQVDLSCIKVDAALD